MNTQPFPNLNPAKEAALRSSIRRRGVIYPIVRDQHGRLLDGHQRERIAAEEGRECCEMTVTVGDDKDAEELIRELNTARRWAPEERQEEVAALLSEGHSPQAVAEALGVNRSTVRRDRDKARRSNDQPATPARTRGLDNKSYPATRAPRGGRPKTKAQLEKEAALAEEEEIRRRIEEGPGNFYTAPRLPKATRQLRDRLQQSVIECMSVINKALNAELDPDFAELGTSEKLTQLRGLIDKLNSRIKNIPSGNKETSNGSGNDPVFEPEARGAGAPL